MRKNLKFGILAFAIVSVIVTGCSKDDSSAPTISLTGSTDETVSLPTVAGNNATWTDAGFTATDDEDGTLTSSVIVSGASDVNLNRKGIYTVTYSVSDKAGNSGSATRTIRVVNDVEVFAGAYNNCTDTSSIVNNYNATVITSDTVNNLVKINNFGAFGNTVNLYATFAGSATGSTITMPAGPSVSLGGTAYFSAQYPANSFVVTGTSSSQSFTVNYQWNDGAAFEVATSYFIR